MDLAALAGALTSLKAATDIAKWIRESNTSLEQAELNLKMAEMLGALADAKVQIADVKVVLLDREQKIFELEKSLEVQGQVVFESPYYLRVENGDRSGPYCQSCYDDSNKLIRLQEALYNKGCWTCNVCDNTVYDKNYKSPPLDFGLMG